MNIDTTNRKEIKTMNVPFLINKLQLCHDLIAGHIGKPKFDFPKGMAGGKERLQCLARAFGELASNASSTVATWPGPAFTTPARGAVEQVLVRAVQNAAPNDDLAALRASLSAATDPKEKYKLSQAIKAKALQPKTPR